MSEKVSIREFARRVSVSDTAIRKGIASGKISKQAVTFHPGNGRPELLFDIAIADWRANGGGLQKEEGRDTNPKKKAAPVNKEQVMKEAVAEVADNVSVPQQPKDSNSISLAEAKRQAAIYDSKLKGLELAERQKILVPRDKVYRELFAISQEVRTALQGVPDKYIDNILACKTRSEAHSMLYLAITEALEGLTNELKL